MRLLLFCAVFLAHCDVADPKPPQVSPPRSGCKLELDLIKYQCEWVWYCGAETIRSGYSASADDCVKSLSGPAQLRWGW